MGPFERKLMRVNNRGEPAASATIFVQYVICWGLRVYVCVCVCVEYGW